MAHPAYAELQRAIADRLAAVADREHYARDPSGHLARLQDADSRTAAATAALPPDTDPMLRHYLERCSYVKALAWLDEHVRSAPE